MKKLLIFSLNIIKRFFLKSNKPMNNAISWIDNPNDPNAGLG